MCIRDRLCFSAIPGVYHLAVRHVGLHVSLCSLMCDCCVSVPFLVAIILLYAMSAFMLLFPQEPIEDFIDVSCHLVVLVVVLVRLLKHW